MDKVFIGWVLGLATVIVIMLISSPATPTYHDFALQGPETLQEFLNEQLLFDTTGERIVLELDGVFGRQSQAAWSLWMANEYHAKEMEK